jgi:uncharacterized protein (TIGR00290 family)
MRVFVSWSGGKDSCLALYRAIKEGFVIGFLFSMLDKEGLRSASHGLTREVLEVQAEALGHRISFGRSCMKDYEREFKRIIGEQKNQGIDGGVFGDINLREHREWIDRVCGELGIKAFFPLWDSNYDDLLNDFLGVGFEATVISGKIDLIREEWIGKPFDSAFIHYLKAEGLDLLGEKGEFHTLVTNGPIFKHSLKVTGFRKKTEGELWIPEELKVQQM